MLVYIHNHERFNEMENFKIYNNGKYDYKANLALKLRQKLPPIIDKIDHYFTNH